MPVRRTLVGVALAGLLAAAGVRPAAGDDCLRPERVVPVGPVALGDLGELALERLPWNVTVIRADLSANRPVAVAAFYLMARDLLVVSQAGSVYSFDRATLTPRWVSTLKAPLAAVPAEGPHHYTFLVKAHDGSYWVHAWNKRTGAEADRHFPLRLRFAASAGLANDGSRVYVSSLGSPVNNRTVESFSLADGSPSWGWRTRGLLWASPVLDPSGNTLIVASEDGGVIALPAARSEPNQPDWVRMATGAITATPVVTPEHVVVGSHDGIVRALDLSSGTVTWLQGLDAPIKTSPWVLGRTTTVRRPSPVEGAPDIQVEGFTGIAFARNLNGLFAFDLGTGERLFHQPDQGRPVAMQGRWVATLTADRTLLLRDAQEGYAVKGRLGLHMFDLVPTNASDGAIYGISYDGQLVAAIPQR